MGKHVVHAAAACNIPMDQPVDLAAVATNQGFEIKQFGPLVQLLISLFTSNL